jgi:hypothetical protein
MSRSKPRTFPAWFVSVRVRGTLNFVETVRECIRSLASAQFIRNLLEYHFWDWLKAGAPAFSPYAFLIKSSGVPQSLFPTI